MGQSATLYEISKATFQEIVKDQSSFRISKAEQYVIFEKNQEGVLFVLAKCVAEEHKEIIQEIFYPNDCIGGSIDGKPIDFLKLKEDLIFYLSIEKVIQVNDLVSKISIDDFLSQYDSKELNDHQVYPWNWHDDESPRKVFNKRDIAEAFQALKRLFSQAVENGNYLFSFVG